jgi:hypothetical protein
MRRLEAIPASEVVENAAQIAISDCLWEPSLYGVSQAAIALGCV